MGQPHGMNCSRSVVMVPNKSNRACPPITKPIPPSTTISTPVTYELSSKARNKATFAREWWVGTHCRRLPHSCNHTGHSANPKTSHKARQADEPGAAKSHPGVCPRTPRIELPFDARVFCPRRFRSSLATIWTERSAGSLIADHCGAGQSSHFDVPHRRLTEEALVLAIELTRTLIADFERRARGIDPFSEHSLSRRN